MLQTNLSLESCGNECDRGHSSLRNCDFAAWLRHQYTPLKGGWQY